MVSQIQKSGEAIKRLDRLAPNLAHICRSIWEWIYTKQIALRDTRGGGALGRGGQESNIQKYGEAVKRLDRLAPTFVHVCGFVLKWTWAKYNSPHSAPRGFRGSQIQKSWEAVKQLDRLAPNLVHVCGQVWEWI